jgi:hypothetical protein
MTIAVDLDKTLAFHHSGMGIRCIGKPIPSMMKRVRNWIGRGDKVVIFTARAGHKGAKPAIRAWLKKNGLPDLEVTNVKSPDFDEMWDDKAVSVIPNKGETWEEGARKAVS